MKFNEIIQEGDKWADAQGPGITIGSDGRYHVPSHTMRKINAMSDDERAKISKYHLQAYNQQKERSGIPPEDPRVIASRLKKQQNIASGNIEGEYTK